MNHKFAKISPLLDLSFGNLSKKSLLKFTKSSIAAKAFDVFKSSLKAFIISSLNSKFNSPILELLTLCKSL